MLMKWKSLFAAALSAAVTLPAWAQDATGGGIPSLSFSFANNRDGSKLSVVDGTSVTAKTALGVEPVPANKWIELFDSDVDPDVGKNAIDNTETISANDERAHNFTLESDVTVTYSAKNAWSVKDVTDQASSSIQPFLQSYLDDGDNPAVDGNTVGAKFTVTGIPFDSYDVIIYFATDKEFAVGNSGGNGFKPITVNGTAYSWTQWQSETDPGYLVSDAASTAVFGSAPESTAILGKNAIRIPALSGDLSVVGAVSDGQTSKRCSIAAFQIVEAKPSFNINFAQTAGDPYDVPASGAYGLAPVPGAFWQNIYGASGTDVPLSLEAYGLHTDAKLTFSAPGTWRFPNGTQVKDPILRGFLGTHTNAANGSTVSVSDIPFTQYDVIVYFATNEENAVFQPVTINGKAYTWDAETQATVEGEATFGASGGNVAIYGTNALRIPGLTGDLTLATGAQTVKTETEPFKTGNLCGIQIVCTGEVTDAAVPLERNPTISVNFARGRSDGNPIVSEVAGLETQALAVVPADAWTNLYPSNTDCDDTVTLSSIWKADLTVPVRVSYQANGTWSDNVEGRPAFLKTFLGDGTYGNKIGSDILVSQIPFSEYEVIVYLATDTDAVAFLPVEINDTLYKGNGTDATVEATAITETYGDSSVLTPTEGVNVIRVGGLSDDLRIKGSTQIRSNNVLSGRCNIAAFQIVCTGEVIDPEGPDRDVISLNYASGTNNAAVPDTAQLYGLEAAPGTAWADLTGAPASTQNFTAAYGASIGQMSTTFSAGGTYQYGADQNVNPFMRGYLDDNSGDNGYNHVSISVPNIPFDLYDVIVYTAVEQSSQDFKPVQVNGTYYTFDDAANGDWRTEAVEAGGASFGQGNQPIAKIGVNAIRVNNQDAQELSVNGQSGGNGHRGGIAAIQIIERPVQEITVNTEMTAQQVFAQSLPGRATKLAFAEGGAITGAVNLSGVAVDLTQVASSPFTGNLTVDANTKLYLPAGTRTYALTTGTVTGSLAAANVFIGGTAIPANAMTQDGANLTFNIEITYEWTGAGGDNLWSTAGNWLSGVVPGADSEVTIPLADGARKTITLTEGAVAGSLTITGPASGTATLAIEGAETAALTIDGQMATSGNVTVTQSANITVNGTSQMGDGKPIPTNQVVQASFQVNGANATYTIESGALAVQGSGSQAGDVSVSNGAILEVGTKGELSAARVVVSYYGNSTEPVIRTGTLRIAGQATFSTRVAFRNDGLTMELAGGTMTTPSVSTFSGLAVSADSKLAAPEGKELTVSGTTKALTGAGDLTLQGKVDLSATITTAYTGELIAAANSTVTLGENRPKLSVLEDATVNITPTAEEQAAGRIAFGTSMTAVPSATFTVEGVDAVTPEVDNGTLTLSWAASTATLATTGDWSAPNWTVGETTGQAAPESGVVVLDGTAEGGITVTLDTAIPADITTINVRGDVTLVATGQQATLPTCINVEDGATLGVDADFAKAEGSAWPATWAIPENTTLRITGDGFDFGGITVDHNQYIQVYADLEVTATGTADTVALIDPANNLWCRGKVTVSCDYVTLKKLYWLDDVTDGLTVTGDNVTIEGLRQVDGSEGLTLSGNNVTITGYTQGFAFADGATITSSGTGNVLDGVTDWPNTFTVTSGDLTIDSCTSLKGALLSNGATLKLASDWAAGQELHVSTKAGDSSVMGLDMSAVAAVNRPTLARYDSSSNALPKNLLIASSAEEDEAGEIRIALMAASKPVLPAGGLAVTVTPATEGVVWNAVATIEENALVIRNVVLKPVLPEGSTLSETATAALNKAATEAGITGEYAVAITTGVETVTVTTAEAVARLQEVLDCFTGVATGDSASNTVTVAYDFGIVDIKRNADGNGWTVTAKVQGAAGAEADFAAGNVYTLTVNGAPAADASATVGENGTVTFTVPDALVAGETCTLGVSVSRTAQQL